MSGFFIAMMSAVRAFKVTGGNFASSCVSSSSAPQLRFQADGTLLRHLSDLSFATSQWGDPVTAGIGAKYWIKVELGTGTAAVSGDAVGSVLSLSVERSWNIAVGTSGHSNLRTLPYEIYSDAAGTTVVGSGTLTLESDNT